MTTPNMNIKVEQNRLSGVPIDFTKTYNQGDMLKWDSTNKVAVPIDNAGADAASFAASAAFIGVAHDTQPITSLGQNLPTPRMNVINLGLVEFTIDDNATYYAGDYVTIGGDAQKVKKTGASAQNSIGVVAGENFFGVTSGAQVGKVAVQGTTKLLIWLKPQFQQLGSVPMS